MSDDRALYPKPAAPGLSESGLARARQRAKRRAAALRNNLKRRRRQDLARAEDVPSDPAAPVAGRPSPAKDEAPQG